jgi:hypothetical protein
MSVLAHRAEREARRNEKMERETSPDVVDTDIYGDGADRWCVNMFVWLSRERRDGSHCRALRNLRA